MTQPQFPTFSGPTVLTDNWTLTLPGIFECREQDGLLTFWREDLAIWINAMGTEDGSSVDQRMARDMASAGPDASDVNQQLEGGIGRISYQMRDKRPDGKLVNALYTYSHTDKAQVMIAFYFDDPAIATDAKAIYATLQYTGG